MKTLEAIYDSGLYQESSKQTDTNFKLLKVLFDQDNYLIGRNVHLLDPKEGYSEHADIATAALPMMKNNTPISIKEFVRKLRNVWYSNTNDIHLDIPQNSWIVKEQKNKSLILLMTD